MTPKRESPTFVSFDKRIEQKLPKNMGDVEKALAIGLAGSVQELSQLTADYNKARQLAVNSMNKDDDSDRRAIFDRGRDEAEKACEKQKMRLEGARDLLKDAGLSHVVVVAERAAFQVAQELSAMVR